MIRRPPRSTRTDTLFPYTTLFRSRRCCLYRGVRGARSAVPDPAQECRALYFARRPPDRLRAAAEAARCRDDLGRPRTHPILPRSICDRPRRVRHRRAAERLSQGRSEEHTSELQSLMRISYAVFCLKKKTKTKQTKKN